MLEDAINNIAGIIDLFPDIKEIKIKNKHHITIFMEKNEIKEETFINSVDLLEWCEENLKSTLDDIKPNNKIASFFYRIVKKRKVLEFK
jgi:phage FluMu gp28-like protein